MSSQKPSFKGLQPASEASSKAKRANRKNQTQPELLLSEALSRIGLTFERNAWHLPGSPDIVFPLERLAVFCDGDFWHGRNWEVRKEKLLMGHNSDYWTRKISRNMTRDININNLLQESGWEVLRLWETDIKKDPDERAQEICSILQKIRATS